MAKWKWKGTNTNVDVSPTGGWLKVVGVPVNATAPEEYLTIKGTRTNIIVKGGSLLVNKTLI